MSILGKKWDKYGTDISNFALKNASKFCKTYNGDIEKLLKEKKLKQNLIISYFLM